MHLNGATLEKMAGRLRPRPRPQLLVVDASLAIVEMPDRCVVLPEFFRTGGDLVWDPAEKYLVWTPPQGEARKFSLSTAPDLSALRTGPEKKGTGKAWGLGILGLLILPALWVHLFFPSVPTAPSLTGIPYSAPSPGPVQRTYGTEWMK